MSDAKRLQVPWASLLVLATFVGGALIPQQAFDLLRPPEKERAQATAGGALEVEARLWEDPFLAVRRHEAERLAACKPAAPCPDAASLPRRQPAAMRALPGGNGTCLPADTLLMAVLVPGNPFVGAEEARRRTRLAVLSAMQAEGYLPESAEQIGLLTMDVPAAAPPAAATNPAAPPAAAKAWPVARMQVPFEHLSVARQAAAGDWLLKRDDQPHVMLAWIDETALPTPKLDALAWVLQALAGPCTTNPNAAAGVARGPRIALLGPSTSDGLRLALERLASIADPGPLAPVPVPSPDAPASSPERVRHEQWLGWKRLAHAEWFNHSATIARLSQDERLDPVPTELRARRQLSVLSGEDAQLRFQRTIATDEVVLDALAQELRRRLPTATAARPYSGGEHADGERARDAARATGGAGALRIVMIAEADSVYARAQERELSRRIVTLRRARGDEPDLVYFFRGLDGTTAREAEDARAPGSAARAAKDPAAAVEWPEARGQLDYLRRIAAEIRRSELLRPSPGELAREPRTIGAIGAIGIFANDVHDKLLVLQALRETFPDRVFFTTDLDARLLHPRTLPFTRNLLVASSLPLQFPIVGIEGAAAGAGVEGGAARLPVAQLHAGEAPWRDVYQASTYAAARLAVARRTVAAGETQSPHDALREQLERALARPSVYEIGREYAVPLAGLDLGTRQLREPTLTYRVGLFGLLAMLALALAAGPLGRAVTRLRAGGAGALAASGWVAAYAGVLALAAATVVQALSPKRLGFEGTLGWTLAGVLAGLLLAVALRRLRRRPLPERAGAGLVAAIGLVIAWAVIAGRTAGDGEGGEPLLWLQGVSAWPSQVLHVAAIAIGLVALDRLWQVVAAADAELGAWLAQPAPRRAPWSRLLREWRAHSLLGWALPAPGSVCFDSTWRDYLARADGGARLRRIVPWWAVAVALGWLLFQGFGDGFVPLVPVRGEGQRALVAATALAALALLTFVVVAVADASMLARRLLLTLGRGRTIWPKEAIDTVAAAFGATQAALWRHRMHAEPSRRAPPPETPPPAPLPPDPAAPHTLLDDWLDIQLLARLTQHVTPLVIGPFAMLAVLLLARSRLFDGWSLAWPILATAGVYVLWLSVLVVLLKFAAERSRARALERMQADLRWVQGHEALKALVEPMKRLVAEVEAEKRGAFAPPFDQWLFGALLVPLGSAGGVQLVEKLLGTYGR
jgi:hypothetical protein